MTAIAGLEPWGRQDWLPGGDKLPTWLAELPKRQVAPVDKYQRAIAYAVDTSAPTEAANRAHRRAVRNAVAAGKEPPTHEQSAEVDTAKRSSSELRHALGRGPDGLYESERQRIQRQRNTASEPSIPDVDAPENAHLTTLDQEVSHAAL